MINNLLPKKLKFILTIVLLLHAVITCAQTDSIILTKNIKALHEYYKNNPVEKVHLHLDRTWYNLGDTIWFKAYVVTGPQHQLSALSGVLYAELINEADTIKKRLNLQLNAGMANGDFMIPYTYKPGTYRIRAYTNWMRNDSDYFFDQKVIVGGITPAQIAANVITPQMERETTPDVQFFPEGGNLVNGLRSKVAFKAVDKNGQSVAIKGSVIDNENNEIAVFDTQHAGMGNFALKPESGKSYRAVFIYNGSRTDTVKLQPAINKGFTLTINNTPDTVYIKIAASDSLIKHKRDTAFYLIAQSGGNYYFTTAGKLDHQIYTTKIAATRFPTGIVQFTLFSQSGEPLNERVVFINNGSNLNMTVVPDKERYSTLEKVKLLLEAKNNTGTDFKGSFSIAVTDLSKAPVDAKAENTIFTDLLLSSELKGNIEEPNYYFNKASEQTRLHLDLLMLTQGYRRFEWKKVLNKESTTPVFPAEAGLSLAGKITSAKKPIPMARVSLLSVKDVFSVDTMSNSAGEFIFNNLNFTDTTKLMVKTKKGAIVIKPFNYPTVIKQKIPNNYLHNNNDTLLLALNKSYIKGKEDYFKSIHHLKEVEIKSRRSTYFKPKYSDNMNFSSNLNGPGNANQVILGENLHGCIKLSDCLRGKLFGVLFNNKGLPISVRAVSKSISGSAPPMAVIVDGIQFGPQRLDEVDADNVYSIEVLTSGGYLSIYGSSAGAGALIITMKRGADYNPNVEMEEGLTKVNFEGFFKAREFYSPKYDIKKEVTSTLNDNRSTIYWNPNVLPNENGKAEIEFFNSSTKGTYRVVLEGIDDFGNLGRKVFSYEVQ